MNIRALVMIEDALQTVVEKQGRRIERLSLYVSPQSLLADKPGMQTTYGWLRISPGPHIPKGFSFIREDTGAGTIGFSWVSKIEKADKHVS